MLKSFHPKPNALIRICSFNAVSFPPFVFSFLVSLSTTLALVGPMSVVRKITKWPHLLVVGQQSKHTDPAMFQAKVETMGKTFCLVGMILSCGKHFTSLVRVCIDKWLFRDDLDRTMGFQILSSEDASSLMKSKEMFIADVHYEVLDKSSKKTKSTTILSHVKIVTKQQPKKQQRSGVNAAKASRKSLVSENSSNSSSGSSGSKRPIVTKQQPKKQQRNEAKGPRKTHQETEKKQAKSHHGLADMLACSSDGAAKNSRTKVHVVPECGFPDLGFNLVKSQKMIHPMIVAVEEDSTSASLCFGDGDNLVGSHLASIDGEEVLSVDGAHNLLARLTLGSKPFDIAVIRCFDHDDDPSKDDKCTVLDHLQRVESFIGGVVSSKGRHGGNADEGAALLVCGRTGTGKVRAFFFLSFFGLHGFCSPHFCVLVLQTDIPSSCMLRPVC